MAVASAKENILKRIKEALINPVPLPFPESEGLQSVYPAPEEDAVIIFAEEFTKAGGKITICSEKKELKSQLKQLIEEKKWDKIYCAEKEIQDLLLQISVAPYTHLPSCDVSVTGCEFLAARTGSVVLSAAAPMGRTASVYAPVHICIAYPDQVVYDIKDALQSLKEKYGSSLPSFISFATGPSRTADIEKTLVTGVHGPREVYCFLAEM